MSSVPSKEHVINIDMEAIGGCFQDFDDQTVYHEAMNRAMSGATRNFAVKLGEDEAQIAFDLGAEGIQQLLQDRMSRRDDPATWINIWAPNKQKDAVAILAKHYHFSQRLQELFCASPRPSPTGNSDTVNRSYFNDKDEEESFSTESASNEHNFYDLVTRMIDFHSFDTGSHCANWVYDQPKTDYDDVDVVYKLEFWNRRLWSWIILCDDNTVISIQEDPGPVDDMESLRSTRANTLGVLRRLSKHTLVDVDLTSLLLIRELNNLVASIVFYSLFDDWRTVFGSTVSIRQSLTDLRKTIIRDMVAGKSKTPSLLIIPRLHMLGLQIRQMQSLHEVYVNLAQRVIEPVNRPTSSLNSGRGVMLAPSAVQHFERLKDRMELLILKPNPEFLSEKEALLSSYFNTLARLDSEATIKLTGAATLLAKLGAIFLPVSLMTSYFSIQISELEGVYTVKDYWYAFAVVLGVSFLGVFFFSNVLVFVAEAIDTGPRAKSYDLAANSLDNDAKFV